MVTMALYLMQYNNKKNSNQKQIKVTLNNKEISSLQINNLSRIVGRWLAVQQKEISKITKID